MENIKLNIEGMHCTGCSTRLEKVLNSLEGVKEASVDFESKIAIVTYNKEVIDIESIKEAIDDAGFEIV